ncbi:MAG: NUDIX domain-containing protein [Alphaproteobacteria bacterium]|nr:NUDIX domain-containing protein [Alphaproteobacteria bacterium]
MARDLRTRAFQAWWRLSRPVTLGVRGVVIDPGGRVLLVRHTYMAGWHFPGGGVERRETAFAALNRELEEEAGIAPSTPPRLVSVHANHANFPNDHVLVYRIDHWTQGTPTQVGEIAETGFFAPEDLPEGVSAPTRRRLAELFEGAAVSDAW